MTPRFRVEYLMEAALLGLFMFSACVFVVLLAPTPDAVFRSDPDKTVKHPSWLNDPIYYHNRGDSTFAGESSNYGDFGGRRPRELALHSQQHR